MTSILKKKNRKHIFMYLTTFNSLNDMLAPLVCNIRQSKVTNANKKPGYQAEENKFG